MRIGLKSAEILLNQNLGYRGRKQNIGQVPIYWEYMHFGKIPDMLWLSQVFENVNIADTLEIVQVSLKIGKPQYLV